MAHLRQGSGGQAPIRTMLVTGGAGFIGSSLAIHFKQRDPDLRVIAFDNLRRRGAELNVGRVRAAGVEFSHGDVRVAADLEAFEDGSRRHRRVLRRAVGAGRPRRAGPLRDRHQPDRVRQLPRARADDRRGVRVPLDQPRLPGLDAVPAALRGRRRPLRSARRSAGARRQLARHRRGLSARRPAHALRDDQARRRSC